MAASEKVRVILTSINIRRENRNQNIKVQVIIKAFFICIGIIFKSSRWRTMEVVTERELSIERRINQKHLYSQFPEIKWNFCRILNFNWDEQLNETVIERYMKLCQAIMAESFLSSGSVMEGALLARNLNPKISNKYHEVEIDIMFPLTKILRNRSREVIVDLQYAKGFTWIKYKPGCFNSPQKLDGFLVKHEDGNIYLNSEAVKDKNHSRNGLSYFPGTSFFTQETIKGPSANLEMGVSGIKIPSTVTLTEAIKVLQECVGFIENASDYLERFHCDVSLKLKKLEKLIQGNHELISLTNLDELASRVLPAKKERKNLLLEVHWMLLALINQTLSKVFILDKMLPKQDLIERLGILKIICDIDVTYPKEMIESLDSFLKYLFYSLPKEVYEKYKTNPRDSLFHFFQKCIYYQQDEMEKIFQFLSNFKSKLSWTSVWLEFSRHALRNTLDLEETFNALNLRFSFDRVPAITVEDFPYIASEWVTRDRKWPSLSVVKEIVMSGCHIVPKPYYGKKGNNFLDWRWSFSVAEIILAQFRTRKMNTSYLILKSIFYKYLKPIEHDNETLSSYFVKTVMLWQCEENDETWWSDKSTVKCVSVLLNRLKMSFYNKHLSHYFIREINLFDNVADELVLYGEAILESICVDPIVCIKELLKFYPDVDESETSKKTVAETGLEFKLKMPLLIAEAQEKLKVVEEKRKDQTQSKTLGGEINLLKIMFEELMPKLFPKVPTGNFSEENYLHNSEINFDNLIKTVETGFSEAFDIPLD